ncbi:WD40 repeat domain-containing protein, partial [Synechococcus sp. CS-1325]|uniref:WD40 repeat domain-containing protein n=1 Tax=Synechococcus sp. CS-1325 TaxID=2847979 RepID=UPI00223B2616
TSGRCTHTLEGHSGNVDSIAWSPDGSCLASGSDDKTIRMWDPTSGRCTHTLEGHSEWVRSIAWSPDGSCLASGSDDKTIRMWDHTSGRCTHTLEGHSSGVTSIAWSQDGSCLASASWDKTIQFWRNDLSDLLHTPLATYRPEHWDTLENLVAKAADLGGLERSWITFVAALGTIIRRFDVILDEALNQQLAAPFEIEIDA